MFVDNTVYKKYYTSKLIEILFSVKSNSQFHTFRFQLKVIVNFCKRIIFQPPIRGSHQFFKTKKNCVQKNPVLAKILQIKINN